MVMSVNTFVGRGIVREIIFMAELIIYNILNLISYMLKENCISLTLHVVFVQGERMLAFLGGCRGPVTTLGPMNAVHDPSIILGWRVNLF